MLCKLISVRTNKPAATSNRSESATCPITKALPSGLRSVLGALDLPSFSEVFGSMLAARSAGAMPKTIAQTTATANVKPRTRRFGATSIGNAAGPFDAINTSSLLPHHESPTPASPPINASNALSASTDFDWNGDGVKDAKDLHDGIAILNRLNELQAGPDGILGDLEGDSTTGDDDLSTDAAIDAYIAQNPGTGYLASLKPTVGSTFDIDGDGSIDHRDLLLTASTADDAAGS